jgi:hypothetical protein
MGKELEFEFRISILDFTKPIAASLILLLETCNDSFDRLGSVGGEILKRFSIVSITQTEVFLRKTRVFLILSLQQEWSRNRHWGSMGTGNGGATDCSYRGR